MHVIKHTAATTVLFSVDSSFQSFFLSLIKWKYWKDGRLVKDDHIVLLLTTNKLDLRPDVYPFLEYSFGWVNVCSAPYPLTILAECLQRESEGGQNSLCVLRILRKVPKARLLDLIMSTAQA